MPPPFARWSIADRLPEPSSMVRSHSIMPFQAMPHGSKRSNRRSREIPIFSWFPIWRLGISSSRTFSTCPERGRPEFHCASIGASTIGQLEDDVRFAQRFKPLRAEEMEELRKIDRKSTRLNSSHLG